jgi:hypothetical protein
MKIRARYTFTMCTIFRLFFTRYEIFRSHSRKWNDFWSTRSRIILFCLKILIFIIFFQSDSSKSTQHAIINEFLNIIKKHDLILTLFKEFITWKNRITINILDFMFMTFHLIDKLKHCTMRFNLNQSSNHISISICIFYEIESNSFRTSRRTWNWPI